MNQYLLLRDNKQTGPYSAEELAAKGLKPYDLVWLEGRSAAWRYPGELEELKPFAPVVEEQPYDRFFKKPGEQATQTTQQQVVAETNTIQESQPVNKQAELVAKHIYVTMPVGKTQTATTPVAKKEEAVKPVAQQSDKNVHAAIAKNAEKKAAVSSYIVSEEDDELNSGLLKGYNSRKKEDEEVNDGFLSEYESRKAALSNKKSGGSAIVQAEKPVEMTAPRPAKTWAPPKRDNFDLKTLLAGSSQYLQNNKNVTRALVAVVLILGGVVIGLVINSGHKQPDTQVLESLVKEIREKQNEKASTTAGPNTETVQHNNEPREKGHHRSNEVANNNIEDPAPPSAAVPANNNPANQSGMRQAVIKKDNSVVTPPQNQSKSIAVPVSNTNTQPVENNPVMEPREKAIDREVVEKARKNIYEQVHIEASAFKVGILGGISDLDITVQNTSLYALDQVAVEVKYFGPEKKLVKSQTLLFNNVPPGKRRTLEAPSTRRGITIEYTVTSINSKALGLAQNGF